LRIRSRASPWITASCANKPWALAIDATTLFVALDNPFLLQQIVPR
jgi:hypothetical protein